MRAVDVGESLYVLGDVRKTADGQTEIAKGENRFFISTKSEEQLLKSLGRKTILLYVLGVAFIVGGIVLLVVNPG